VGGSGRFANVTGLDLCYPCALGYYLGSDSSNPRLGD
jgi:hypothetical protein